MGGYPARGSDIPSVKAYSGPLPPGARGVQFTTPVLLLQAVCPASRSGMLGSLESPWFIRLGVTWRLFQFS